MKHLAKSALCAIYKYSGVMRAQETLAYRAGRSFMTILLFHRVTDDIPRDGLTVGTGWFRDLCKMLRRRFNVQPLAEVMRLLNEGGAAPPRTVAVTFDDCYRDNLFAARILAEQQLPASFFIPSGIVGTDHVFEWDRGLKAMPNLTWDEVREIADLGHEIGSHTVSHPDLAKISEEVMRRELIASRQRIEAEIGRRVRWLAYPFGGRANFRAERLPIVYEAGYEACFSGYGGFVDPSVKGKVIPRDAVPCFDSLLNLELHLSGCLGWMYALKRRVGLI
ncbi:MAG: polysaccharide deacetylase family protein [Planctomycetes bacterium]|nr:polysaccharide deacetylase family protein [Planctomycetota bacterium]